MIDYTNPIDPFEHVKVQKTEAIGQDEEAKTPLVQKPVIKKMFLYLALLKILSNLLKIFRSPQKPKELDQTPIHQEIQSLKSSLDALKEDDLCQNTQFMNFFAFIWMKLLKDYPNYFFKNAEITSLINKLIQETNSYPKNSDFTLGYYISEFAGYKWIPFPYMEILRNLHLEHKKDPENSHLTLWTDLLDKILSKV